MSVKARRIITAVLAIILAAALLFGSLIPALADDSDDPSAENSALEEQKAALEQEQADAEALANATEEEIAQAQQQLDDLNAQIEDLDSQMQTVSADIRDLDQKIEDNSALLEQKHAELVQAQQDLDNYYLEFKDRIQIMYENDRTSYLEVLLESSSISDFFSRLEYISQMVEYDNEMIQKMDEAQQRISDSEAAIQQTENELEAQKAELEDKQAQIQSLMDEKQTAFNELDDNRLALVLQAQEYDAQMESLSAQISDLQEQIDSNNAAAEASRAAAQAAAEEAARQASEAAAEAARQASEAAAAAAEDSSSDAADTSSDTSTEETASSSGDYGFIWPLSSFVLTSGYGYRVDPYLGYYRKHTGVDLATDYGTPIYASKSGTVIYTQSDANNSNGYGIACTIQHEDGFLTIYGHMSALNVTSGQWVEQGEVIGYVGSTGWSTGPHLHFEILYGSIYNDLDPLLYLP